MTISHFLFYRISSVLGVNCKRLIVTSFNEKKLQVGVIPWANDKENANFTDNTTEVQASMLGIAEGKLGNIPPSRLSCEENNTYWRDASEGPGIPRAKSRPKCDQKITLHNKGTMHVQPPREMLPRKNGRESCNCQMGRMHRKTKELPWWVPGLEHKAASWRTFCGDVWCSITLRIWFPAQNPPSTDHLLSGCNYRVPCLFSGTFLPQACSRPLPTPQPAPCR